MKKNFKRLAAVAMTAAMVFGTMTTAFADSRRETTTVSGNAAEVFEDATQAAVLEGGVTGGSVEAGSAISSNSEYFKIELPTVKAAYKDLLYKFWVDGTGYMKKSNYASISGQSVSDNTTHVAANVSDNLFFQTNVETTNGATTVTWSSASAELSVVNKSTETIKLELKVEATSTAGIKFAADKSTAQSEVSYPALYLALESKVSGAAAYTPTVISKSAVTADAASATKTVTIAGAESNYVITASALGFGGTLSWEEKPVSEQGAWPEYLFRLSGAANQNDATHELWKDSTKAPSLKVTWKVTKENADAEDEEEGNNAATTDDYKMSAESGGYTYTFVSTPTGSLDAASFKIDGTARAGMVNNGLVSYSDGVFTINSTATTNLSLSSGSHTVKATIGGTEYTLTIEN